MSNWTTREREYDRIAASRLARLNGGIATHLALGSKSSQSLRWKMRRMGLSGPHVDHAISLVDDVAMNELLSRHPIGVRFATIPRAKKKIDVWDVGISPLQE